MADIIPASRGFVLQIQPRAFPSGAVHQGLLCSGIHGQITGNR
jgi:hypothetical protein